MSDQQCLNDKCKHFVKHYSMLCSSECDTTHIEEYFFGSIEIPSLAAELRKNLKEPITIEEVVEAILSTQSGNSPRALMGFNLNSIKNDMFKCLHYWSQLREEPLPPTFYSKKTRTHCLTNNLCSEYFSLHCGARQVCPAEPLLFANKCQK